MEQYRKLIAALVGVALLIGVKHGVDLTAEQGLIVDLLLALGTALGVWAVPNTAPDVPPRSQTGSAAMGLVLIMVALACASCALFTPAGQIPVSASLSQPAQAAQSSINEANVLLTAAANVVAQNYVEGISTRDEARAQVAKIKEYSADVDRAKRLLEAGDVATAASQAELAKKLIIMLHREVAAKARESK